MSPLAQLAAQLADEIRGNPAIGFFVLGIGVGWHLARRSIRYMMGGKL